jgi:hypothetical protein
MSRVAISMADFEGFASPLVGLPVSHIWQGYGSTIFLEFGILMPGRRRRRDGSLGNPCGEFTLIIESWRIEGKRRIWCGSSSDAERWPRAFLRLQDATVTAVSVVGRLPEIDIALGSGLHVVSCITTEGDPEWGLIKRQGGQTLSVGSLAGRLMLESKSPEDRQPHA